MVNGQVRARCDISPCSFLYFHPLILCVLRELCGGKFSGNLLKKTSLHRLRVFSYISACGSRVTSPASMFSTPGSLRESFTPDPSGRRMFEFRRRQFGSDTVRALLERNGLGDLDEIYSRGLA